MPETYGDIGKVLIQVPIWVTGPVLGEHAVEKAFKVWRWIMYVRFVPHSLVAVPNPICAVRSVLKVRAFACQARHNKHTERANPFRSVRQTLALQALSISRLVKSGPLTRHIVCRLGRKKPDEQGRGGRGSKNMYALTVLDTFHIAPRLALRAKLYKVLHTQAERELLLELVALV